MRMTGNSPRFLYATVAVLLVLSAGLAFALWQESRTETVTFEFGGERLSVEAEGG